MATLARSLTQLLPPDRLHKHHPSFLPQRSHSHITSHHFSHPNPPRPHRSHSLTLYLLTLHFLPLHPSPQLHLTPLSLLNSFYSLSRQPLDPTFFSQSHVLDSFKLSIKPSRSSGALSSLHHNTSSPSSIQLFSLPYSIFNPRRTHHPPTPSTHHSATSFSNRSRPHLAYHHDDNATNLEAKAGEKMVWSSLSLLESRDVHV